MNRRLVGAATIAALILGFLLSLQVQTQKSVDLAEQIQAERLDQIAGVLRSLQDENARLSEENHYVASELERLRGAGGMNPLLAAQLEQLKIQDGTIPVQGLGVKLVITDSGPDVTVLYPVNTDDLCSIINTLRFAGAEAISINGQRVVGSSSVVMSGNATILINSVPIGRVGATTYEILAIGDPDTMHDYLSRLEVFTLKQAGMRVDLTKEEVTLPSYKGSYYFDYASRTST
ncbi:MAG: DUF881 domain-containing protein [Gracilibacteraceae bacterium]|jgi:uncharacterized protein YlxW (UPF0749 family)|nr:DUF881 domain-containing protein [Gracilibacteraceae bacterium]